MSRHAATAADIPTSVSHLPMFAIEMRPARDWASVEIGEQLLREHMVWLRDREAEGVLLMAGTLDYGDDWTGDSICVLNVPSRERAEAIAASEPFHRAGIRINRVRELSLNIGALTIRVDLMAGAGKLIVND